MGLAVNADVPEEGAVIGAGVEDALSNVPSTADVDANDGCLCFQPFWFYC